MMKTNLVGTVLAIALVLIALGTAWMFINYLQLVKELQPIQLEMVSINRRQTLVQGLLNEAIEYSKRDPSLEPLLQSMGIGRRTNAAPVPTKPAAK